MKEKLIVKLLSGCNVALFLDDIKMVTNLRYKEVKDILANLLESGKVERFRLVGCNKPVYRWKNV